MDPRFNNLAVPSSFANHPLIANRVFFALPRPLLEGVVRELGDAMDSDLIELEFALSDCCGDHSQIIGYWNRWPIRFAHLRPSHQLLEELLEAMPGPGSNAATNANVARVATSRIDRLWSFSQGYSGWLTTNRTFLNEHDALFSAWGTIVRRSGLSMVGVSQSYFNERPDFISASEPHWDDCKSAFQEFFVRWRLSGLAAPGLPLPISPLVAGGLPQSMLSQIRPAGVQVFFPDTFPIPSRDELRGILEDALRGSAPPEHLTEWFDIIRTSNPAKSKIDRFARLFELQHYWRILHHRHGLAIEGRLEALKRAVASFLGKQETTIHPDLLFIRKRLGPEWPHRMVV
jgi:hypothetical protein